jgi:hypothetical protein
MAYEPEKGDVVALYINKFRPENFEKGVAIMSEEFIAGMDQVGHTRRSFWIADPEASEVIGIAFFGPDHPTDDWHDSEHRLKVRKQLDSLLQEPLVIKHCKVVGQHRVG